MLTITFETLKTTADLAEQYIHDGLYSEHFLIIAKKQVNGRGRKGNNWLSPPGGLWFNLVLHHTTSQKCFTLYIGYCVLHTLITLTGEDAFRIKWPNDIYLYNKKIAGIICSQFTQHSKISIGIGINTNCEVSGNAGAIKDLLQIEIDNEVYLNGIVSAILLELDAYEKVGLPLFYDYYSQHDLLCGKQITIDSGESVYVGFYNGINNDGGLVLTTEQGVVDIYAGSVIL